MKVSLPMILHDWEMIADKLRHEGFGAGHLEQSEP